MITEDFDNVNPDQINNPALNEGQHTRTGENNDISSIDKNGDGQVTIKEAKSAEFKMPVTKEHCLYQYMDDRNVDGLVGE